ncbi:MAG: CDP-alcohol phosphatidyltransferase family protein [Actinomycetota bacterium]
MNIEASSRPQAEWRTVPNLLSFGRLALTPVLGWLIIQGHTNYAVGLFGVMGVSDYFDGWIARRTNTVTDLGTTLDPVSDRILAMVALVTLMMGDYLPVWMGLIVLLREAALSVAFLFLARRGFGKPRVRRVGKTATFALFTALPGLMLGTTPAGEFLRAPSYVIFGIGAVLYYVAAYRYFLDMRQFLAALRTPFHPEVAEPPQ